MEELSIEERATRYNEALEYARYLINEQCKEGTCGSFHRADLDKMFPELRESDDERIRKEILEYFQQFDNKELRGVDISDWIAWLEQGEQKPVEWHREDEQNLNACLGFIPDEFLRRWLTDVIHEKYDNHTWSEEDETGLTNTIIMLKEGASLHFNKKDITKAVDFLRTLKERYTWRPSDEQMEALKGVQEGVFRLGILESLYNDLLKLK